MAKNKRYPGPNEREEILTSRRHMKMARSSHAYVRGNTQKFYDWLGSAEGLKVPQGPAIWICGDCHTGNLGPVASAKGVTTIQIRDLDQTVIGNPAHDLIRLGLSLASAARGSDLPGVATVQMIEQVIEGYEAAFSETPGDSENSEDVPEVVRQGLEDADSRTWKSLARERIKDTRPHIPLGKRFWPLSKGESQAIHDLFATEKARRLVTSLKSRDDDASVEVLDAAYWVKGCSSLGLLRYAVLIGVGGEGGETCLIDVKEAVKAAAPSYPHTDMPKDNAERVVDGAWHISPSLGDRMLATSLMDTSVFLRELLPQDLKFDIDALTVDEAIKVARYLAGVVGKAHARQMDEGTRTRWLKTLTNNRTKTLEAPSWLWAAVVELLTSHEGAYLDHCRKHAAVLKAA